MQPWVGFQGSLIEAKPVLHPKQSQSSFPYESPYEFPVLIRSANSQESGIEEKPGSAGLIEAKPGIDTLGCRVASSKQSQAFCADRIEEKPVRGIEAKPGILR